MSGPCTLELWLNGQHVDPDDAAEVMDEIHEIGLCPRGPLAADLAIDTPTTPREVAVAIARMLVPSRRLVLL